MSNRELAPTVVDLLRASLELIAPVLSEILRALICEDCSNAWYGSQRTVSRRQDTAIGSSDAQTAFAQTQDQSIISAMTGLWGDGA